MRVMISQPTEGLTEEQARDAKRQVIAQMDEQGHEVWGELPSRVAAPKGVNEDLWQLGRRLQDMSGADAVYFMDGWEKSKNCRLFYEAAVGNDLIVINAEWRELKSAFSVEQTLYECFPDEMKFGESVEEVANRMIRYCREMCNRNREYWKKVKLASQSIKTV